MCIDNQLKVQAKNIEMPYIYHMGIKKLFLPSFLNKNIQKKYTTL